MASLYLIPWAGTAWSEACRLAGRTALPLSEAGAENARRWAEQLQSAELAFVFSSDEPTSTEVATIIAERAGATHKLLAGLVELDVGLWDGLTEDELNRRYPKIFKKWQSDPASVSPPEGEPADQAYERLARSMERLTQKYAGRHVAVVLGPVALALVRCWIESVELAKAGSLASDGPLRYEWAERRVPAAVAAASVTDALNEPPLGER